MKAAYLVTETAEAANILRKILPQNLLQDIEVVSAGAKYAAVSLAGTIMSERARPVLLIVDAESNDLNYAKEREQTLTGLLLPAASAAPYQVCVAIPSIATMAQNMNSGQLQDFQQHPLMQRITHFFSTAFSQAA
jgi:hypothetical protein